MDMNPSLTGSLGDINQDASRDFLDPLVYVANSYVNSTRVCVHERVNNVKQYSVVFTVYHFVSRKSTPLETMSRGDRQPVAG